MKAVSVKEWGVSVASPNLGGKRPAGRHALRPPGATAPSAGNRGTDELSYLNPKPFYYGGPGRDVPGVLCADAAAKSVEDIQSIDS